MTVEAKLRISADSGSINATRRGIQSISDQLKDLRSQALAFFGLQQGAQGIAELARMADAYSGMNARLKLATSSQAEFNTAMSDAKAIARQFNQPLDETVKLYTRMLSALKPLGGGINEASIATKAMNASLKISGATSAEAASAILQFSQAMGSGVLRGEEFNAINEASPRLLSAIAAGLGKTTGEMKGLAEQGQLTTSAVVRALATELPKLQAEAAKIPPTISGAYQGLKDAVTQYMGKQTEANGSAQVAATVLKLLADNMNLLLGALQLISAVGLAMLLGKWAAALALFVAGLGSGTAAALTFNGALTSMLGLFGGAAGLIALLGLAAGGFTALAIAKLKAAEASKTYEQQAALSAQNEIDRLKQRGGLSNTDKIYLANLQAKQPEREARAAQERNQNLRDDLRRVERTYDISNMSNDAALKKVADKYPMLASIRNEARDDRRTAELGYDWQINNAREKGDLKAVADLEKKKGDLIAEINRDEKKKVHAFNTRDALTRIDQAKQQYDKELELLADATGREQKLLEDKYSQGVDGLHAYLEEKGRLAAADAAQDTKRLEAQLAAERVALANNTQRKKTAKDPNAEEQYTQAVAAGQRAVAKLEADIIKRARDLNDEERKRADLLAKQLSTLRAQMQAVDTMTAQGLGTESEASIAARLQGAGKANIEAELDLGGDGTRSQALIDLQVRQALLAKRSQDYQRALTELELKEAAIQQDLAQARITEAQAEERLLAVRQAQLPTLQAMLTLAGALAKTPEERQTLERTQLRLDDLKDPRQDQLRRRTQDYQRALTDLELQEAAIQQDQAQGRITEVQAEERLLALRKAQIPVLQELLDKIAPLAKSKDERQALAKSQNALNGMADYRTAAVKGLQLSARAGFEGMFSDIVTGTKTVKAALADMLGSFAKQMLDLIGKRLGAKLFESFGLGNFIDGGIATVASLFGFHSGGVVSAGGASFTRAIPAGVAALAANFAPRYHSGGIVGLRRNERMAVLEDGEEVLTANDPRHRFNGGLGRNASGMVANVSVTVNTNGSQGGNADAMGADLGRTIEASIDQWALKQSRPGGRLARA